MAEFVKVELIDIDEEFNSRGKIDTEEGSFQTLLRDIKTRGVDTPITVRPIMGTDRYLCLMGNRRLTACKILGMSLVPAVIRTDSLTQLDMMVMNVQENLVRANLNQKQEAKIVWKFRRMGLSDAQIAAKLNLSRSWVQQRTAFARFPDDIQTIFVEHSVPAPQIRAFYAVLTKSGKPTKELYDMVYKYCKIKTEEVTSTNLVVPIVLDKSRRRGEINDMVKHLTDQLQGEPSLIISALLWAANTSTTEEFEKELEDHFKDDLGKEYFPKL